MSTDKDQWVEQVREELAFGDWTCEPENILTRGRREIFKAGYLARAEKDREEIRSLTQKLAIMREALEMYAEGNVIDDLYLIEGDPLFDEDGCDVWRVGKQAKQALEAVEKLTEDKS